MQTRTVPECRPGGVSFCTPGTNAATAAEIMLTRNCDVLLVLEGNGEIAGVVTDFDLLLVLSGQGQNASDLPVAGIMRQAENTLPAEAPGFRKGIVSMNDALLQASQQPVTSSETRT